MSNRWNSFTKQLVAVCLLLGTVWLISRAREVLTPLVLALLLAYLLSFPINWLWRHTGWNRTVVVALVYVVLAVTLVVGPVLVVPRLIATIGSLLGTLRYVVRELAQATPRPIEITPTLQLDLGVLYAPINQWLTRALQPDIEALQSWQTLLGPFASGAAVVVRGAITSLVWGILMLTISVYVAKDGPRMGQSIAASLPVQFQPEARRLWQEIKAVWDAFLAGQLTLVIIMGLLTWTTTTLLGLRNAPALGLLSGLAEFVPSVGPLAAAGVGVLLALILGSSWVPLPNTWFAALVALTYLLASEFENIFLVPRIIGRRVALHPVVVIVGAVIGAQIAGILGLLLAAPTLGSLRILVAFALRKMMDEEPFPLLAAPPDRGAAWQGLLRGRPVSAVLFDLDGTLTAVDPIPRERLAARLGFLKSIFPNAAPERAARRLVLASGWIANELATFLGLLRLEGPLQRWSDAFRCARSHLPLAELVPLEGSVPALRQLAQRYPLGLITCRDRAETEAFLVQHGLEDLFSVVITRSDEHLLKPHPMPVWRAAKRLAVPAGQCVVVGDGPNDVRSATAAGALAVGVLTGLGQEKDLCGAGLVIPAAAQLGDWL